MNADAKKKVPTYVRVTVTVVYITIVRVFLPLEGTISVGCELRAAIYVIREKNLQQSTWRLWGEEKTDNASYTIYLKKRIENGTLRGRNFAFLPNIEYWYLTKKDACDEQRYARGCKRMRKIIDGCDTRDSDDDISHLEWETVRVKFIKAATLDKLVECLTGDDYELESTYINVFFATYRTFTTPKKLLALMLER
ncbi:Ral guanine nucleotide dissociation stimulator-like 1 [Sarracenia purpurea var. burkii]